MSAQAPEPGPEDEQAARSPDSGQPGPPPDSGQPGPPPDGGQASPPPDGGQPGPPPDGGQASPPPHAGQAPASPDKTAASSGDAAASPDEAAPSAEDGQCLPPPWPGGGEVVAAGAVLDLQALLDALAAGGFVGGPDQDADELAAMTDGRMGPRLSAGQVAALAVEHMQPGPALAGWLGVAAAEASDLDEYGLTGVAAAGRRLASWAQAAELAAVAQVASRAAAADRNIGVRDDGRPARVGRDATGQVSLALTMSECTAAAWADLAVTLAWRLPATGQALAAGRIDLYRARRIAEATSVLSEAKAREVEAKILPGAGELTPAALRERLRRAVIAADPDAAERRRADAERRAAVSLYPDEDGTATLSGTGLPAVLAAAAMAKITAMARARKAAGLGGGLDLHRAQVMLGLLLDTLPPTPPADGAPPDQPPTGDPGLRSSPDPSSPADGGVPEDVPFPGDDAAPPDDGLDGTGADDTGGGCADDEDDPATAGPTARWPELGSIPAALSRPAPEPDGRPVSGLLDVTLPWTTLAGQPGGGPGLLGRIGPITPAQARQLVRAAEHDPAAQWRIVITNAAGQAITVTRIGRQRSRAGPGPPDAPQPGHRTPGTGLVGRITLTISQDIIRGQATSPRGHRTGQAVGPGPPRGIAMTALRAAVTALDEALARADADAAADGCAHTDQSPAYRPPPRLREHITARDVTCRNPVCRQPAWRADLDHTIPHDQGGRTCRCNLGGGCRRHHQLKQNPRWKLQQAKPGIFTWTTPAGRTYTTEPDGYPL